MIQSKQNQACLTTQINQKWTLWKYLGYAHVYYKQNLRLRTTSPYPAIVCLHPNEVSDEELT